MTEEKYEREHRKDLFKRDAALSSFRRMQGGLINLIKELYEKNLELEVRCSVAEEEIIFLKEEIRKLRD